METSKREYVKPGITVVEIGSVAMLSASGNSQDLTPSEDEHKDASKAMIGTWSSPWNDTDD
jgi:hypothetical protein